MITGLPPRQHLYLSSVLWSGFWIIQQPICHEIQRREPVLFVERPVSLFTVLRHPERWRRLFAWLRGARRVSPNLRVLAPLPLFHLGHRFPRLFRLDFAIQRRWILFWARRLTRGERVLWMDHPLWSCAIGRMGEQTAVYHVGDDVAEFPNTDRRTVTGLEQDTLKRASVVFAAATGLGNAKRVFNPRTYVIQNAIDGDLFRASIPEADLADVAAIPAPRVCFVGVIDHWVDVGLIDRVAAELPEVDVVIIGVSRLDLTWVRTRRNVHFMGPRDRRVIPGVLRLCSASLVPFKENPLTARIMPAKIWEALAAGILPVCTPFTPNLDELEDRGHLLVGRSPEDYVRAVKQAVAEDGPERRSEIGAFGLQQTWSARWSQMDAILRDVRQAQ